jgi:ABC-type Co2+ transport system permease subunit
MPFPPGHYREVSAPRLRRPRERWVVALAGLLAALVIAVTLVSLTSSEGKSGHGCLNFTYAMVMGGERLHECGAKARTLCAQPPSFGGARFGGLANDLKARLKSACRDAGLPYATSA